jgi:glucokinase
MITLGTGVGGGIIIDGKVYSGFNCAAGELGHIVIQHNGRPCSCGRKGCWEAYSSATALTAMTREKIQECREKGIPSLMVTECDENGGKVSARTAFACMKKGDAAAKEVVDTYIDYLACGIANMINIFQPEVLSIGGGICHEGDYLLTPLKKRVFEEAYTKDREPKTKLVIAALGNDAGIIGAASLGR